MNEIIKEVVSAFTDLKPDQLHESTPIDRKAVKSSIQLHMMYARLAERGVVIEDYRAIRTFGQLLNSAAKTGNATSGNGTIVYADYPRGEVNNEGLSVGIDIEQVSSFPAVNDFREDEFYKMNFAPAEIAYCILQKDPRSSFAGLFACKEAIVKADNGYINQPFHSIVLDHSADGKPGHAGFQLSISHTQDHAVAVAVQLVQAASQQNAAAEKIQNSGGKGLVIIAILLSLAAIVLQLIKWI